MSKQLGSERHLCVRLPADLFARFERALCLRSVQDGRRQSTQQIVQELVAGFVDDQLKPRAARR